MEGGQEEAWSSALPPCPCFADVYTRQDCSLSLELADRSAVGASVRDLSLRTKRTKQTLREPTALTSA